MKKIPDNHADETLYTDIYPTDNKAVEKEDSSQKKNLLKAAAISLVIIVAFTVLLWVILPSAKPRNQTPLLTDEWMEYALKKNEEYTLTQGEVNTLMSWKRYGERMETNDFHLSYDVHTQTYWTVYITTPLETIELNYMWSKYHDAWELYSMSWLYRFYYKSIQDEMQKLYPALPDYEE